MAMLIRTLAAAAIGGLIATSGVAQDMSEMRDASPFLPIENEPAPGLAVDPPLPGPLARGAVLIPYRTENFRILPVFGAGASSVSPRVGHLHVTVDDLPWRWADTSDTKTVVVVGLPPGDHSVRIELASPEHHVYVGQTVKFTVPGSQR